MIQNVRVLHCARRRHSRESCQGVPPAKWDGAGWSGWSGGRLEWGAAHLGDGVAPAALRIDEHRPRKLLLEVRRLRLVAPRARLAEQRETVLIDRIVPADMAHRAPGGEPD